MGENLYEIAVLIDDLKNEDMTARLNSVEKLHLIADALGKDRTRNELLPYMADSVDDEDEVLLEMAKQLGPDFVQYIGGDKHIHKMFQPLKALAVCEDPSVRIAATDSLVQLSERMSDAEVKQHLFDTIKELFGKNWFTSRFSCCSLMPAAYRRITDLQIRAEMRDMYVELAGDSRAIVRRAAIKNLQDFAIQVEKNHISSTFFEIFRNFAGDDEDSVRSLAVDNVVTFMGLAASEAEKAIVVEATNELSEDKSWKIRWNVAQNVSAILDVLESDESASGALLIAYVSLLQDDEPEVRKIAALKLPEVAKRVKETVVVEQLLPQIVDLALSFEIAVREALASVITDLLPIFYEQGKISEFLKPYLDLVGDEDASVRLAVMKKLNTKVPGPDINEDFLQRIIQVLLPAFYGLIDEMRWRIRNEAIQLIPMLAEQLGIEKFTESLADTTVESLSDEAFENRMVATNNIRELYEMFGGDWISTRILPKLNRLSQHESYLIRMQSIRVIQSLASGNIEKQFLAGAALPLLSELATDATPNVKFNVAKCLQLLKNQLETEVVKNEVKPMLTELQKDTDEDVVYFATEALKAF